MSNKKQFKEAFLNVINGMLSHSITGYKSKSQYKNALEDLKLFLEEENMTICQVSKNKPHDTDKYFIERVYFLIKKDNTYAIVGLSFNETIFNVVMYNLNNEFIKEYFIINDSILKQCDTLYLK